MSELLVWLRTSGLRILVIVAGTSLLARLLRVLADRIPRLVGSGAALTVTEAEKRARTMASLLRTVGVKVLLVIAALMVLREFGLDITPLIAGAGVVGLAIGLGAQSLIKKARFDRDGIQIPYPHRIVITRPDAPRGQ